MAALGISFLFFIWDCLLPSSLLAQKDFDARKLSQMRQMLKEDLKKETPKPGVVDVKTKKVLVSNEPIPAGVIRVKDTDVARPASTYREAMKIVTGADKTLLQRIALDVYSTINYDSNVFRERENPRDDWYYTVGPRIQIDATNLYKALGFELSYRATWNQYFSFRRLNRLDHNVDIQIPGRGKVLRIGKKLTVEGNLGFAISGDNDASSIDQSLYIKRVEPYANVYANYLISRKFSTDFNYGVRMRDIREFEEPPSVQGEGLVDVSSQKTTVYEHKFMHRLRYHITPKTNVFAGAGYGFSGGTKKEATNNYDSSFVRVVGGIEGKLTPKSVVSFEGGWEIRGFKTRKTKNGVYLRGAYMVQFTRKLGAQVIVIRDDQLSAQADVGLITSTSAQLGLNYRINSKLSWTGSGGLRLTETDKIPNQPRSKEYKDFDLTVDTSLKYYINRWLALRLAYALDVRRSDDSSRHFVDHLGTFGVTVG